MSKKKTMAISNYESLVEDLNSLPEENSEEKQDEGLKSTPNTCILIINDAERHPNRKKDADRQQTLFPKLGFYVSVYHNQTADEITKLVDSVKAYEGAFILSIISPGDGTRINCIDGIKIPLSDLELSVSKISQDPMVPKVAIFDIYQADRSDEASNNRNIANIENALILTSATMSGNDSQLTKVLYEEIARSNKDPSLSQIMENVVRKLQDQNQQQVEINDTLQKPYYIKCNSVSLEEDPNSSPEENSEEKQDEGLKSTPNTCILIINDAENRKKDAEWQQLLFLTLGFDVKVHHDQTADEIIQLVDSVRAEGAFILSIISPGDQTSIHCSDGKTILLSDLESKVSKTFQDPMVPKLAIFDIHVYQANGSDEASNYRNIANIENHNTLILTSVTMSGNDSQLTKVLYEEIARSNKDQSLSQIMENVVKKLQDQYQQQVEINGTLQKPYYIKRGTHWLSLEQIKLKFKQAANKWIPIRDETLQHFDETIDKLIEHRRKVNIAQITGSAVSIGGAAVAVIGFALTPVTFGASLALSVGGIAVAAAGGGVAAGASIADVVIQKAKVKETQEKLDEDQETLKPIVQLAGEMKEIIDVLLVPIDIAEIVRSGISIRKGNKSDAVIKLQKLRGDLKEQKITIHKIAYPEKYQN